MLGFGFWPRAGGGGGAAPVAAISSLEVLGPGPLPDGADAADGNGWVARVSLPDLGAAVFDPGKIVLTIADPGFDSDGAAVVRQRTVTGTAVVRRQQPNQAQRLNGAAGGVRTVHFALSDELYVGSTVVSATAGAGFYGAAQAGAIVEAVNGSTVAYPKPLFAWLNLQHERATGAGFAVEAVAYHRHAMLGQQVACVKFRGTEGANATAWATASQPALSDFQTKGLRVEAWKASIPLAALTQGQLCQVNAVVYPWIGEAWDLGVEGVAWPTAQPQTLLRFLNDRTGGYGGGQAWVKPSATGGAVGSNATPYPTIEAALAGLRAWNAANKGHNDHSGSTLWLMETAAGAGDGFGPKRLGEAGVRCAAARGL